jgi:hypothetical protein
MLNRCNISVFVVLLFVAVATPAYEQETHRELSTTTVANTVLSAPTSNILTDFGLSSDISKESLQRFPNSEGKTQSIIQLIEDGADFEDKFPRSVQHFYDPFNDQPLHHPLLNFPPVQALLGGINASPDWALEDNQDITQQEYSYKEAMTAFFEALTLPTKTERDQQWGKLFESLGNVIHHIQDMAQPEHVRNDLHCPEFWGCGVPGAIIGVYDPSLFENHSLTAFEDGIPPTLVNYPSVTFPTAREFWTTRDSDSVVTDRRGLADFTNRNFVSKDTNFEIKNGTLAPSSRYSLPVPSGTNLVDLATLDGNGADICQRLNQNGPVDLPVNSPCEVEFIKNIVTDSYDPIKSGINARAASLSLFDQYLGEYGVSGVFVEDGDTFHVMDVDRLLTINEYNINAAHEFLIPRAIAYGAGLIDHFFQTRVFAYAADGVISVTNPNSFSIDGDFELWAESISGERQLVTSWQRLLLPGQSFSEAYAMNMANNGTDGFVVFRGSSSQDATMTTVGAVKVPLGYYSSEPETTWSIWAPSGICCDDFGREYKTWGQSQRTIRTYYRQHDRIILEEKTLNYQLAPNAEPAGAGSVGTETISVTYSLVQSDPAVQWQPTLNPLGLDGTSVVVTDSVIERGTYSFCNAYGSDGYFPLYATGYPDYYSPPQTVYPGPDFRCALTNSQTNKELYQLEIPH